MTLELSGAEQLLLPGERSCGEGQPRLPCGAGGISVSHSLFGSETAGESPNPCGSSLDKGGGEAAFATRLEICWLWGSGLAGQNC